MKREQDEIRYYDFRLSPPIIAVFMFVFIFVLAGAAINGIGIKQVALLMILFFALGVSYGIKIVVDRESLYISYGVGLFSSEINLAAIESCGIPENRFLLSWAYSPLSKYALEVRLRGGGRIVLPSGDPKALAGALRPRR